jgi:CcmD family protein
MIEKPTGCYLCPKIFCKGYEHPVSIVSSIQHQASSFKNHFFHTFATVYQAGQMIKNRTMLIAKKKALSTLSLLLLPFTLLLAQQDTDFMRSMGKMYVVVAVILAIFVGIIIYLVRLDRKLTKLEDQIKNHE